MIFNAKLSGSLLVVLLKYRDKAFGKMWVMQTNEVCRSRFEYQKGYLKVGFAHICEADFQVAFLIHYIAEQHSAFTLVAWQPCVCR